MSQTIGIFSSPLDKAGSRPDASLRSPLKAYRWAVQFKANPRSVEYMQALFAEQFPGAAFIDMGDDSNWRQRLPAADKVVLLYPDATGLGFSSIERELASAVKPGVPIEVLNGRRRSFRLTRGARARLLIRRFLERSMLMELLVMPLLLLATPFLLLADALRGRR